METGKKMAIRSCGTCRDRRILCDRTTPTCTQCSRSKRHCTGYGLRLSWPKANDGKRAVVVKPSLQQRSRDRVGHRSDTRIVNVSSWDLQMHHYLLSASETNACAKPALLSVPMPFNPLKLEPEEGYLCQYFKHVACRSLTTLGHNPTDVGDTLMRMALTNTTPSEHSTVMKMSAIRALGEASRNGDMDVKETMQHVAAGMLLCSIEIQRLSCVSGQWVYYIRCIKDIIKASNLSLDKETDSIFAVLLDWLYYHDVMARFSFRHWRRPTANLSCLIPHAPPSHLAIVELLYVVCGALSTKPVTTEETDDHQNFLKVLEWRIRNVPIPSNTNNTTNNTTNPDTAAILQLFQLATLVYLDRASEGLLNHPAKTQQRIDRGFTLLSSLETCERQFPIFVIGCEARTDHQRLVVLDLIARTEKKTPSRSFMYTKSLLNAIWAQDDLADEELDYSD